MREILGRTKTVRELVTDLAFLLHELLNRTGP
jgi:hypothetical protein